MEAATLPQYDPNPPARAKAITDAQIVWQYGEWQQQHTFAERTPAREMPRLGWLLRLLPGIVLVFLNEQLHSLLRRLGIIEWTDYRAAQRRAAPPRPPLHGQPDAPTSAAQKGLLPKAARALKLYTFDAVDYALSKTLGDYGTTANPSAPGAEPVRARPRHGVTIADFVSLYRLLPRPPIVRAWQAPGGGLTDATFAWLRVAGPNPEMLCGAATLPDGFAADMKLPSGELAAHAAAEGRLFLADYAALDMLKDSSWHGMDRYVSSPRALFAIADGQLVPAAIQCDRGADVFQPGDDGWELAKRVVQVADGNYHELIAHLGRTHLFVEIFLMATRRHLAGHHPLARLLLPHFEGTVFINSQARKSLIAKGGAIDRIFAGTIETSQQLAIHSLQTLDLSTYDLPTRTAARATGSITEYPWRDDALRVWKALATFVDKVVAHAYADPNDLAADDELRAWSATLAKPVGAGGVHGFAPPRDRDELARILTVIIFTASAQHAAVNFTQYPFMSFAPLLAGSGWAPAPTRDQPPADLISFLPPRQLALQQAGVLYQLSSIHHTRLGVYAPGWFCDPHVETFAAELRRDLATVEAQIEADNRRRTRPYEYLLPRAIPQSINI